MSVTRRLAINLGLLFLVATATSTLLFLIAALLDGELGPTVLLGVLWGLFFAGYSLPIVVPILLILEISARFGAEADLQRVLLFAATTIACGVLLIESKFDLPESFASGGAILYVTYLRLPSEERGPLASTPGEWTGATLLLLLATLTTVTRAGVI